MTQTTRKPLTGIRRAALVLASLPREEGARLLGRLGREAAERIGIEIASLGELPEDAAEEALRDFVHAASEGAPAPRAGAPGARELLREALSEAKPAAEEKPAKDGARATQRFRHPSADRSPGTIRP